LEDEWGEERSEIRTSPKEYRYEKRQEKREQHQIETQRKKTLHKYPSIRTGYDAKRSARGNSSGSGKG
jgi:hypothetical protein